MSSAADLQEEINRLNNSIQKLRNRILADEAEVSSGSVGTDRTRDIRTIHAYWVYMQIQWSTYFRATHSARKKIEGGLKMERYKYRTVVFVIKYERVI